MNKCPIFQQLPKFVNAVTAADCLSTKTTMVDDLGEFKLKICYHFVHSKIRSYKHFYNVFAFGCVGYCGKAGFFTLKMSADCIYLTSGLFETSLSSVAA